MIIQICFVWIIIANLLQNLRSTFFGAEWADREKGFFKLPWKHGKNKGFSEEKDGELFKEWAINTGKAGAMSSLHDSECQSI